MINSIKCGNNGFKERVEMQKVVLWYNHVIKSRLTGSFIQSTKAAWLTYNEVSVVIKAYAMSA